MQLRFIGQLLNVEQRSFTSSDGSNKGREYTWTELSFNSIDDGSFTLKTVAPVEVDPKSMRIDLDWNLSVEPRTDKNKTSFKVSQIAAGKAVKSQ